MTSENPKVTECIPEKKSKIFICTKMFYSNTSYDRRENPRHNLNVSNIKLWFNDKFYSTVIVLRKEYVYKFYCLRAPRVQQPQEIYIKTTVSIYFLNY